MRSITHMRTTLLGAAIAGLLVLSSCTASPTPSATFPGTTCPLFPANNVWHAKVTGLPVHARSAAYVASIGRSSGLKADFGSGDVGRRADRHPLHTWSVPQPNVPVTFDYDDESDPGPYPIPPTPRSRAGPRATATATCSWSTRRLPALRDSTTPTQNATARGTPARARSSTCSSNALRPAGWTSADAAGLPILPGPRPLRRGRPRHDRPRHPGDRADVAEGLRLAGPRTRPARRTDRDLPPMGLRLRLKASFDISGFDRDARVILKAR